MAGSLIKIDEFTVSSAVASVTIGGGSSGSSGLNTSIDSTYDVYKLVVSSLKPVTDAVSVQMRFTASGTPDTSSNYDRAFRNYRADTSFGDIYNTNQTYISAHGTGTETSGQEMINYVFYLFNFNNASEYSFCTMEASIINDGGNLRGFNGGAVLTVAQATDGVNYSFTSGNIASGKFKLYGLKK